MRIQFTPLQLLFILPQFALGNWGNNDDGDVDATIYGDSFTRDWLYDSTGISMKLEGCVWGYVYDSEEAGCLEDSSEDGTTSWYQMANCRRAQAAFSLYATDSSDSAGCNSNTYKETFVTKTGVNEFIDWLQENDENNPFGDNGNDDGGGYWNIDELPMCEQGENGYLGLGCNSDGTFSINTFYDQYCLTSTGVYDTLDKLNYQLKTYKNCVGLAVANGNDDGGGGGEDDGGGLSGLLYYAESCSSIDSGLCIDDPYMSSRRSSASSGSAKRKAKTQSATKSWHTKLKYALGAVLLVASFVMFTGILFTNRRRRRALMQRKYRQSRRADGSRKSSRSKSRDTRRSRSSRRSKSKGREKTQTEAEPASGGVFT